VFFFLKSYNKSALPRQTPFFQAKCAIVDNCNFQPVTIETTGVYGKSTALFLNCLAKKLVDMSGDPREQQWLHQRLSMAVVKWNADSILACVQV